MKHLTRRQILQTTPAVFASLAALPANELAQAKRLSAATLTGGLCLNEDNSHYFMTRAGQTLTAEKVATWVDQYANTQVRELMLSVNCMRTSYASKVWDPIWRGYDPQGPDDQPLLASTPAAARQNARNWIHTAWQLQQAGIDAYQVWLKRARQQGIGAWLSMRMNDVHNVDDVRSYLHSEFWRAHPEYWRVPYRLGPSADRALDYGQAAVRAHHFKLIEELAERYDFDGLELDWMRFGYHFKPGHERAGLAHLTEFTAQVRRLLDHWEKQRGHKIKLGARVPSRPATALGLGYDVSTWAQRKLIDMLVVTPFWASIETDMPIELWKDLLRGTGVTLAAGLEVLIRTHPESKQFQKNTIETVRGAAASLLDRGAERVYLFNYLDSQTAMADLENYPTLLRECGQLATLSGKPRRHVLTFADTWAPGEAAAIALPKQCDPNRWYAFRLATGPVPAKGMGEARLGIVGSNATELAQAELRVNGALCPLAGLAEALPAPKPEAPVYRFAIPRSLLQRGYNLIEFSPKHACQLVWVEIAIDA